MAKPHSLKVCGFVVVMGRCRIKFFVFSPFTTEGDLWYNMHRFSKRGIEETFIGENMDNKNLVPMMLALGIRSPKKDTFATYHQSIRSL